MFREMRRSNQQLTDAETLEILKLGTSGTLAVLGDNGYPYAVPLSYVYDNGKLYFHCARTGHKLDAVKSCNKASFCVIAMDNIVPEEFTTYYKSAIAFGKIAIIENAEEQRKAIEILSDKYCDVDESMRNKEIDSFASKLCMLKLDIEHMTGKTAKELK